MKITLKKSFAVILALVMCVSVLFGMNLTIFAASNTIDYVYDSTGTYIYNWGTREQEATFLSPMAIAFYEENNVSLNALLALDGSSIESDVPSSALYTELHDLMESNHSYVIGYDATRELFRYTDCENSGSPSTISSFYSGAAIGPDWDNGATWNREHTWPNSKGDEAGKGEDDIMMLRPAATSENNSRRNKAYGESTEYFNPNIGSYDLRGDVARIILYQYVRWECTNTGSSYNPTGIFDTDGVIESQAMLLDWLEADPVDTWELGRNDAVEAITGTRNVFVDYPELAFALFDEEVPDNSTYPTPSGGESIPGTNGTGGTQVTVTYSELGITSTVSTTKGQSITLSAPKTALKDGYKFAGWVTTPITDKITNVTQTIYEEGESYTVNENTKLYALYYETEVTGGEEVTSSNAFELHTGALTEGDYLIVYNNGAMSTDNNGTGSTAKNVVIMSMLLLWII